jgi:prolyl-tRNA synthetase
MRRDTMKKTTLHCSEIPALLTEIQTSLFAKHKRFTEDNTRDAKSYEEFKKIMETTRGFIKAFWCENPACEASIKAETKASTRLLPLNPSEETGACVYCSKPATHRWYFAQSY